MKGWSSHLEVILAMFAMHCASGPKEAPQCAPRANEHLVATANLVGRSGSSLLGNAVFTRREKAVEYRVQVQGAPPGLHGVFLHERGDCSGADAGTAGDVFNPLRAPAGGPGRLGDLLVHADGTGALEGKSGLLTIPVGPLSVIFRAVVIGGPPSAQVVDERAAPRIGCGVITLRPGLIFPSPEGQNRPGSIVSSR